MARDIRAILLCGGAGTRFGGDKLLALLRDGTPIAAHAARNLLQGAGNALAVIPIGAAELRSVLEPLGCAIVESQRTAQGMGESLAAAITATERADGWIVALGDMPLIRADTIAAVRAALEAGALLAAPVSERSGERGHPVGFSAALRDELVALRGDRGARSVLERHRDLLHAVATDDEGIFTDLDTREQLAALAAMATRDPPPRA